MSTTEQKTKGVHVDGKDLIPPGGKRAVMSQRYAYWVGQFPSAPAADIAIAGIGFPKITEVVTGTGDDTKRRAQIGTIEWLTRDRFELLKKRLKQKVIRFNAPRKKGLQEFGAGSEIEDNDKIIEDPDLDPGQRRGYRPAALGNGQPINIPTEEDYKAAMKEGRTLPRYEFRDGDEPAADYIFCVLCENQERPHPGSIYPEPLSKTGLHWPGE